MAVLVEVPQSHNTSTQQIMVKKEGVPVKRHAFVEAAALSDVSIALISPGFSKTVLNDSECREKLKQSLDVRSKQQDLIQRRLNVGDGNEPRKRPGPERLSITRHDQRRHGASPYTAPLQGSLSWPRDQRSTRVQYRPPQTPRHPQTLPPLQGHVKRNSIHLPSLKQSMTPVKVIPQPIQLTPPTSASGTGGLDALSRAARLNRMKETYLRACEEGFDAFHGL